MYTVKNKSSSVWQEHKWSQGLVGSDLGEDLGMEMATQSTLMLWKALRTTYRKRRHVLDIFVKVKFYYCHVQ